MTKISVFGAGKSAYYLLKYLSETGKTQNWQVHVYDKFPEKVTDSIKRLHLMLHQFDIENNDNLDAIVAGSDMLVSMLPPALHLTVAKACLKHEKNLATASYVSDELKAMDAEVRSKGLVFLNELGLDPGIDHLSAMKIIDDIKARGGEISSFESYCGGLVDKDDCAENPWGYKFSWNPRNVVLAGQGGSSVYRKNGQLRYIPWHQLFAHAQTCYVPDVGSFDAYPNRDSLAYVASYGLENTATFFRATLRRRQYCRAWQVLVSLGFTDAATVLHPSILSTNDLCRSLTGANFQTDSFASWLLQNNIIDIKMKSHFDFLELDSETPFRTGENTAAEMLQTRLEEKWKLLPEDKDEVVMFHHFSYTLDNTQQQVKSVLHLKGDDSFHTAMAKTVGLPLALGVELILRKEVKETGVVVPLSPEWYHPILSKLETLGILFNEERSIH